MEIQLLLALLMVLACQGQRNNLPGTPCGDKQCVRPEARCEDPNQGICECKGNTKGDGNLACHSKDHEVCSILRSSTVENFNGDGLYRLTQPCRYLATTFETQRIGRNTTCKVTVWGHGERRAGRFYTRGFDTSIVTERSGTSRFNGYRARGERIDDDYLYTLERRNGQDDFWFEITSVDNSDVQFGLEDLNARVKLDAMSCGLTIIFRPEKVSEGRNQRVVPGLVISVDKMAVDVTWPQSGEGVCLTPTRSSGGQSAGEKARELGLRQLWAMNYIGFTSAAKNLHMTSPCDCEDLYRTMSRCTDSTKRRAAYEMCHFIIDNPVFVTCIERAGGSMSSNLIDLYNKCISSFCTSSKSRCRKVQSAIRGRNCEDKAESDFMNFNCATIN